MDKITRVGVDLAKRVYQVHAVDRSERPVLARPMSPQRFEQWAATLPAGCMVAMESCSGAHHLARRLRLMGLDARLIAAHFITPSGSRAPAARMTPTMPQPSAKLPPALAHATFP